ncbi:MAG: pyrroline-5-carboxylate reductase [Muribaculaceae bacterium]|nr:pyrroline-5-carboxylate reductase [Muribaculaceae bacterium]
MKKIAIIGVGNMGSAVAESLKGAEYEISCTAASQRTLDRIKASMPEVNVTLSNQEAVKDAEIVILAVKPYLAETVCSEIEELLKEGTIVISLIAGVDFFKLGQYLNAKSECYPGGKLRHLARVIPNTAIKYGKSVTFIAYADGMPFDAKSETEKIFSLSGKVFVVPENKMAACTSLASCGIAYFLRFIRAAVEGAVEIGLKPDFATEVAALTSEGAAALLANGSHPEVEIDKVTTPGGLTIRGLNALEAHGLNAAVIAALKASTPC